MEWNMATWFNGILSLAEKYEITLQLGVGNVVYTLLFAYLSYNIIYGFFFCPTRHLPGPFVSRFGQQYLLWHLVRGNVSADISQLHERYGISIIF